MSTDPFIGEIKIFGFDFAPRGYQFCAGQLLPIAQNTALFSLIGVRYGGNGTTTFSLPDLRGRVPINQGQSQIAPTNYLIGHSGGTAQVTLTGNNLPAHSHTLNAAQVKLNANEYAGDETIPNGNYLAAATDSIYSGNGGTAGVFINGLQILGTTDNTGANIPINIQNPYLVLNYSIAITGIFPTRS
uniref:phage tail protein n=1 Tax=Flavobacterium sp. TaxID=239 RepID=UPI00404AD3C7